MFQLFTNKLRVCIVNVKKEARRDAYEYARAKMYYGEGAGTRRKLINAAVDQKILNVPGYQEAFDKALVDQDMANHAEAARKERHRKDVSQKVNRNVRGLITGNKASLTTGVAIVSGLAYLARETGYDQKIKSFVRIKYYYVVKPYVVTKYSKAKRWIKAKKAENTPFRPGNKP